MRARVAELADAQGSPLFQRGTLWPLWPCGFEPHPAHSRALFLKRLLVDVHATKSLYSNVRPTIPARTCCICSSVSISRTL